MTKRTKRCVVVGCGKTFRNRSNLRAHLRFEHFIVPDIGLNKKAIPVTESKPQRRIRMMHHAAECKKYRDKLSKLMINPVLRAAKAAKSVVHV